MAGRAPASGGRPKRSAWPSARSTELSARFAAWTTAVKTKYRAEGIHSRAFRIRVSLLEVVASGWLGARTTFSRARNQAMNIKRSYLQLLLGSVTVGLFLANCTVQPAKDDGSCDKGD